MLNITEMNEIIDNFLNSLKNRYLDAYFTAISIVWTLILIVILFNCVCGSRQVFQKLFGKGVRKEDLSAHKRKYLLQPIFSNPRRGFNLRNSKIHFEIVHDRTRLAKIDIENHILKTSRYGCLWKDIRAYIVFIRSNPMPPINSIKGFHKSTPRSKIFFEGIECLDMKTGERVYYPIEEFLRSEEEPESQILHDVKDMRITCCSMQTLFPGFIPLQIEDFGQEIICDSSRTDDNNGILLSPKLHWFESIIFCSLFINFSFFLTIAILVHMKSLLNNKINVTSITALLLSGFVSLLLTEFFTSFYLQFIKRFYNKYCSEMRANSGTASKCWAFIRFFYMLFIFMLSVFTSVSIPFIITIDRKGNQSIAKDYGFDVIKKHKKMNELVFLLVFLSASILLSLTVWLLLFSIIRYCFRNCYGKVRLQTDSESGRRPQSPIPQPKLNKSSQKQESPKIQIAKKVENKTISPTDKKPVFIEKNDLKKVESKRLVFGTEKLEKDIKQKKKRLTTNTVIAQPTKSVGYLNPEAFRISETDGGLKRKTDKK